MAIININIIKLNLNKVSIRRNMSLEISYMPQWEKLIELEPVVALQSE